MATLVRSCIYNVVLILNKALKEETDKNGSLSKVMKSEKIM